MSPTFDRGARESALRKHPLASAILRTLVSGAPAALALGGIALLPLSAFAQTQPEPTTLPTIRVTADKPSAEDLPPPFAGGQVGSGGRLGLLGNLDVMDTPFNATSFTEQFIQNLQATTLSDVLMSDPSVRFTTSNGHPYQNLRIRGFNVDQNDIAFNGMFGVLPIGTMPIQFAERVEVLNGASAMFTGMAPSGAVGGVVNIVPKRAGDVPLARVSVGYESESQGNVAFDLGRRFGEDKSVGVRVNGSYSNGETSIDGRRNEQQVLAAAIDLRQGDFRVAADVYNTREKWHGGTPAMYWFSTPSVPGAPDTSTNQFPAGEGSLDSTGVIVRGEYAFSPALSMFAAAGLMDHDGSGFINGSHVRRIDPEGTSTTTLTVNLVSYNENKTAEAGLRGNFVTGAVSHEMVLQGSTLRQEAGSASNVSPTFTTNIYNPVYQALPAAPGSAPKTSENDLNSVALVDRMSLFSDVLQLILGVRWQQVKTTNYNAAGATTATYDESAWTPAVAAVWKPFGPRISLYANYVQGLSKGDSVSPPLYAYSFTFAPYKTDQYEAGVKWNAGTITNTLAVYQITRPMLIQIDGNFPSDDGEKRVRGVEWNVFGEITPRVRVLGGVAYADGVQTKTANDLYNGNTAVGVPRWQGNLGGEWDLPWVAGLTLTGQVVATSRQYLDPANTIEIPGWGYVDAGLRYATLVAGRDLVLRATVNNLADKRYYSGSFSDTTPIATMGFGRIVALSASMKF